MISKQIVKDIIKKNNEYQRNKKNNLEICNNNKNNLIAFISNLSREDILDLCALTICGRDNINKCTTEDFSDERKSFSSSHDTDSNERLALYILQKNSKLSKYLNNAIHLTENNNFHF